MHLFKKSLLFGILGPALLTPSITRALSSYEPIFTFSSAVLGLYYVNKKVQDLQHEADIEEIRQRVETYPIYKRPRYILESAPRVPDVYNPRLVNPKRSCFAKLFDKF